MSPHRQPGSPEAHAHCMHAPGNGAASAIAAPSPAASNRMKYTCPMHPEIVRNAPGSCPICGMALEPVMPTADDEESHELVDFRRRFWWTLP